MTQNLSTYKLLELTDIRSEAFMAAKVDKITDISQIRHGP
jgi:hypothetical protein